MSGERSVRGRLTYNGKGPQIPNLRQRPEIFDDGVRIGWRGGRFVQDRVDRPPTDFDGGMAAEIVRGPKDDPGPFTGCRCGQMVLIARQVRVAAPY